MSSYTVQLRYICQSEAGLDYNAGADSITETIRKCRGKIFNFDYPIFDEAYRPILEEKILRHYWMREIGCETPGLFKHYLEMRMNEIMPYFNQWYKSELLEFNPLFDVDVHKEGKRKGEGKSVSSSTQESKSDSTSTGKNTTKLRYSETPQGALKNVETGEYLTNANYNTSEDRSNDKSTANGTSEGTANSNTVEDYFENVSGRTGGMTSSKMLMEFRKTFVNIDMKVILNLNDLFMGIW